MDIDKPIPYLVTNRPIPFYPRRSSSVAKAKALNLTAAADRLADLNAQAKDLDDEITALKAAILTELGPLAGPHVALIGKHSVWDIKTMPQTTVAWKKIAEAMGAPSDLIGVHSVTTQRVYFCQQKATEVKR